MRKILLLCLCLPGLDAASSPADQVRSSATRAVALVQRSATGFYKTQECFSCHDYALPMLAFRIARERGIPVDEAAAAKVAAKGLMKIPDMVSIDRAIQDNMLIDTSSSDGWALASANAAGLKPNLVTAVYARRIAADQRSDGHWTTIDIHAKDDDGMTALDWAVLAHHPGTVKTLLSLGASADVNAKDNFGFTPLLYAATVDFGDGDILQSLLAAGADPQIADKEGKTALAHASEYPHLRAALEKHYR